MAAKFTVAAQSYRPPKRPEDPGKAGQRIRLAANHFAVDRLPKEDIHHYDVVISPTELPKRVRIAVVTAVLQSGDGRLGGQKPVYDGTANMYCARPLPFDSEHATFEVQWAEPERPDTRKTYQVTLKRVSRISTDLLTSFAQQAHCRKPEHRKDRRQQALLAAENLQPAIQALDVILRYGPASRYVSVGRSLFSPGDSTQIAGDIGGGMAAWRGFYLSARPSMWGVQLNVDVAHTAFYKGQAVIDFLNEARKGRGIEYPIERGQWRDEHWSKVKPDLNGLKVEVSHSGARRTHRVIDISVEPATGIVVTSQDSAGEEVKTSVADYFKNRYKIQLKYPALPCVQVGTRERRTFFPMELCTIASGQRVDKKLLERSAAKMITATEQSPPKRRVAIMQKVREAKLNQSEVLSDFGIHIKEDMVEVTGRTIDAPGMRHCKTGPPLPLKNGAWNAHGKKLYDPKNLDAWALINCYQEVNVKTLEKFFEQLGSCAAQDGITLNPRPECWKSGPAGPKMYQQVVDWYNVSIARNHPIELFFFILPPMSSSVYSDIKRLCDTDLGVPSQCFQGEKLRKATSDMLCHSVLLKINAKLGGVNFVVDERRRHPFLRDSARNIVLGADVTHPAAGDSSSPSIAAVVGSHGNSAMKYIARVRAQNHRQEVIADLKDMVQSLLQQYAQAAGRLARSIVFYRDGVSEGQFQTCLTEELCAIQQACLSIDKYYKPGITFITVQKRHHTRFFYQHPRERGGNIPPGTVVDQGVVHPTDHDFFLCSHFGLKGTSRPAHYYVLWDDNRFSQDSLQQLTYELCHTYVRCTRSVSIPAPVYYAHLVAFRARHHIAGNAGDDGDDGSGRRGRSGKSGAARPASPHAKDTPDSRHQARGLQEAISVQEALLSSMYFV
ncbi:protein argonaute-2-like [Sycon ciliatum]|uniref:protein argonaute-2-like n=1 Tax=Sycon ciliatum TaxID=27933 RepID=UPI0020AAA935|eukprot:scpid35404/ scgid29994/ Protein argonaute-2; Eukaryotic translation initiation factor 2C 2; Protein slicer